MTANYEPPTVALPTTEAASQSESLRDTPDKFSGTKTTSSGTDLGHHSPLTHFGTTGQSALR